MLPTAKLSAKYTLFLKDHLQIISILLLLCFTVIVFVVYEFAKKRKKERVYTNSSDTYERSALAGIKNVYKN